MGKTYVSLSWIKLDGMMWDSTEWMGLDDIFPFYWAGCNEAR